MDCRRSLQIASLSLIPLSMSLVPGCTPSTQQIVNPPPQMAVETKKTSDLPKVEPKASTLVAAADMHRSEAKSPQYQQAQRDELRDMARISYEQALKIDPKNAAAQLGIARLYFDMNDHDRAVAAYQKALKQDPKNALLLSELGMVHARSREWEKAITNLKAALDNDPNNKDCATTLGYCLARSGRIDEALAVFRKCVGEAKAQYNVARMLHHMNQDGLCRQHLDLALRADPHLIEARDMLIQLSAKPLQRVQQ
jgi:tetratricopeptide (TPR) repeat protein